MQTLNRRYCELTSWMAEIKCRHKDMQVLKAADVKLKQQQQQERHSKTSAANYSSTYSLPSLAFERGATTISPALNSTTVITKQHQQEALKQAAQGEGNGASGVGLVSQNFETQIYDLRALTNYTFYVNVLHFVGEQKRELSAPVTTKTLEQQANGSHNSHRQQRPSRRLDLIWGHDNELTTSGAAAAAAGHAKFGAMIETTKPFSAEAVKCLAGSSEVLVNTGRYFGGRISVEGQLDSRCQLLGNKSSDQTVYSFHIDHEVCHSKIMVSYNPTNASDMLRLSSLGTRAFLQIIVHALPLPK